MFVAVFIIHVAPAEPSLFQRFIGFFSSNDESEVKFSTNDIEMTTFSVVSGQSPSVLTPSLCCSAAGALKTQHGKGLCYWHSRNCACHEIACKFMVNLLQSYT